MKVAFVAIGSSDRSRTGVYRSGLGPQYEQVSIDLSQRDSRPTLKRRLRDVDVVVVATGSQLAVRRVRAASRAPIVLDAGWPLWDGTLSRRQFGPLGLTAAKTYAIDYVSAAFSNLVLVESESQREHYARLFPGSSSKLRVLFTGVDESALGAPADPEGLGKLSDVRVLWRGSYNPESGLEVLWRAIPLLSDLNIQFTVLCRNMPEWLARDLPPGVHLDTEFHHAEVIGSVIREHDVVLGQLSNHTRLNRTIPHKAYEAAYMGVPYLTARMPGIEEFLGRAGGALWFEGGSETGLAERLRQIWHKRATLPAYGTELRSRYLSVASQRLLVAQFQHHLREVASADPGR